MVNIMQPILHLDTSKECNQIRAIVMDKDIPVMIKYHSRAIDTSYPLPYIEYKDVTIKEYSGIFNVLMQLYEQRTPDKVFQIEIEKGDKISTKLTMNLEGKLKLAFMYTLGSGFTFLIFQYVPNINSILLTILLIIPLALILFPSLFGKIKNQLEEIGTNMNSRND